MVLSKLQAPGSGAAPATNDNVVSFLREFKTLECSCCDQLMGFQHRVTGVLFCTPGCRLHKGVQDEVSQAMKDGDQGKTNGRAIEEHLKVEKQSAPRPGSTQVKKVEDVTDTPKPAVPERAPLAKPGVQEINPSMKDGEQGNRKRQVIDENLEVEIQPALGRGSTSMKKVEDVTDTPKPALAKPEVQEIKKPVNPFFRNFPSGVKDGDQEKTTRQVIDERLKVEKQSAPRRGSTPVKKVEDVTDTPKSAVPEHVPAAKPVSIPESAPERKPARPLPEPKHVPAAKPVSIPESAPERKPARPLPEPKRYMYQELKYSANLTDGALVKTCFMWDIHMLQIIADDDTDALVAYQDKISKFVESGKRMVRPPVVDEMVLGEYLGEYYRGRVLEVDGEICSVSFVDFGDKRTDLKYSELFALDEELMKDPIYSACVILEGVKEYKKKVKVGKKLNEVLYGSLQLQMFDKIVLADSDAYRVILWISQEKHLNEVISEVIASLEFDSAQEPEPMDSDFEVEDDPIELEYVRDEQLYKLLFCNEYSEKDLADIFEDNLSLNTDSSGSIPTFSLEDDTINYKARDCELPPVEYRQNYDATVANANSLDAIYIVDQSPMSDVYREVICHEVKSYVESGKATQKSFTDEPSEKDMFLVKWCGWKELREFLVRMKWTEYRRSIRGPKFDEPYYLPMRQKNNKWEGKWFRAFYRNRVSGDKENNEVDCSWYCLIDIGPTIAVPNKYVYRMNGLFMMPPILTYPVRLIMNGIKQFLPRLDARCRRLFDAQPNMKVTLCALDTVDTDPPDRSLSVILVQPTEEEFLKKLQFSKTEEKDDITEIFEEFIHATKFDNVPPNMLKDALLTFIKEVYAEKARKKHYRVKHAINPFLTPAVVQVGGFKDLESQLTTPTDIKLTGYSN